MHLVHEFKVEGYPIEPTLRDASRAIFVMVDPVALAMDDLWRGDLVAARQSVERALHMSGGRERQVARPSSVTITGSLRQPGPADERFALQTGQVSIDGLSPIC